MTFTIGATGNRAIGIGQSGHRAIGERQRVAGRCAFVPKSLR